MPERNLGVRVGEGERPGRDARVVVLLREAPGRLRVRHDAGREREAREAAGGDSQPGPDAEDGIEDRARRPRERASLERLGLLRPAPAAQEARPVGLPFHRRLRAAVDREDVEREERRLLRRPRPAPREEGGGLGDPLRLDEELPEAGIRRVLRESAERELDEARELDLPRPLAEVRQRDAPHLGVVLGRNRHLEARLDLVVAAPDDDLLGEELDLVVFRLRAHGLPRGGPDGAGVDVAQVNELAPRVPLSDPRASA